MTEVVDANAVAFWAGLALTLLTLGGVVYRWVTAGQRRNDAQLEDHAKQLETYAGQLSEMGSQIGRIEQQITSMPGRESLHSVELKLAQMAGDMREIAAHMGGQKEILGRLESIVSRHEDHLLDGKDRR